MQYSLLGRLEVRDDSGGLVDVGGAQPRLVLTTLLLANGRVVPADTLIDAIWGETVPASATGTLQTYISRLRRALGPDTLRWEAPGYRLAIADDELDVRRFERLADEGHTALAAGDAARARHQLVGAEQLWRGAALLDTRDLDTVAAAATRLEERRLTAIEDRLSADLQLGRHEQVVGELSELVAAHPYRERLRARLALALYRSGRQAEALRSLEEARRVLGEELGLDPGPELRDLERAILQHDPSLTPPVAAPTRQREPAPHRGRSLVGRDAELAALLVALDAAGNTTEMVVLEGEPGIGKTRLAEEVANEAERRGVAVAWGRCMEATAAPAYWPWLGVLRALVELEPDAAEGDVVRLLAPSVDDGPATLVGFRLHEAVATLITRVAARRPLLLVIDDLQWADEPSLELLAYLATNLESAAVLALGTVRRLAIGRSDRLVDVLAAIARRRSSRRLQLQRLPDDAVAELVTSTIGTAGANVTSTISTRAEGSPFYAIELSRWFDMAGSQSLAAVPASVRDVIRQRLTALGSSTVELLEVAAVIGRDVRVDVLALAAGQDPDETTGYIEPALVHRLVADVDDQPGLYRFSHALVREVLVDDLSGVRRARLHLAAADALDTVGAGQDDDAELVAEHLAASVQLGTAGRAAHALQRAAGVAIRRSAYGVAEGLLGRAALLWRSTPAASDPSAELDTLAALFFVERVLRGHDAALAGATVRRARELAERIGREDVLARLMWAEWVGADKACQTERANELAESLCRLAATSTSPVVKGLCLHATGARLWHAGTLRESAAALDGAAEQNRIWTHEQRTRIEELTASVRPSAWPVGHPLMMLVHMLVGDVDNAANAFATMAEAEPHPFGSTVVWMHAGFGALAVGDLDAAVTYARRGVESDPHGAFSFWGPASQLCLGAALAGRGEVDDGVALIEAAMPGFVASGTRIFLALVHARAAQGLARTGRLDEAAASLELARQLCEQHAERWTEPVVIAVSALLEKERGAPASTVFELLRNASALATDQGGLGIARGIEQLAAEVSPQTDLSRRMGARRA